MAYTEYITKENDRFDLIAHRFYGNALDYGPIIEANIGVLWVHEKEDGESWKWGEGEDLVKVWSGSMLRNLPAGLKLYIPDRETPVTRTVPPWMG